MIFTNYDNCEGWEHLTIWHSLSGIRHIKVNYGQYSAISNFIKLKIYRAYPYLKPHILFCSNGLVIYGTVCWITGILKLIMVDGPPIK